MTQILWFELAGGRYGLPLRDVREVLRAVAVAPLPGGPDIVEGIIDVRGRIIPVLDIRGRFGIPHKPVELTDIFILTQYRADAVALRVDRAGWPVTVPEADLESRPSPLAASPYVAGVARTPDGLVVINDVNAFLTAAENTRLDEALTEARQREPELHR